MERKHKCNTMEWWCVFASVLHWTNIQYKHNFSHKLQLNEVVVLLALYLFPEGLILFIPTSLWFICHCCSYCLFGNMVDELVSVNHIYPCAIRLSANTVEIRDNNITMKDNFSPSQCDMQFSGNYVFFSTSRPLSNFTSFWKLCFLWKNGKESGRIK